MTVRAIESVSVILTSNFELLKPFLFKNDTFRKSANANDIINAALKDKNSKVFSNLSPDNKIISLKHSYMSGKEGDSTKLITLEIYDYNSLFDLEFLTFNLLDSIKEAIRIEQGEVDSAAWQDFESLKNVSPETKKIIIEETLNRTGSDYDYSKLFDAARATGKSNFISYLTDQLKKNAPLNVRGGYYITYGIGENINAWAGPFRCELANSKVDVVGDNTRRIVLEFRPSVSPYGIGIGIDKDIVLNTESHRYGAEYSQSFSQEDFKDEKSFDFTKYIHNLVKGYITSIYANKANVIVLLPEVKLVLADELRQLVRRYYVRSKDVFYRAIRAKGAATIILSKIFQKFGLTITSKANRVTPQSLGPAHMYSPYTNTFVHDTTVPDYKVNYTLTMFTSSKESEAAPGFKSALDLISQGYDGFKKFRLVEETNVKVLDIWKKYGFIPDNLKPTVVFGAEDFINKLLYGEYADEDTEKVNLQREKDLNSIFEFDIPQNKDKEFNLYGISPLDYFSNDVKRFVFSEPKTNKPLSKNSNPEKISASFYYYLREADRKYTNKDYQKEISNILVTNIPSLYGEEDDSSIPYFDTYFLGTKNRKTDIKSYIPVFRSNIKNSNVLDYAFVFNKANVAVLQFSLNRFIQDYATGVADEIFDVDKDHNRSKDLRTNATELLEKLSNTEIRDKLLALATELRNPNLHPATKEQISKAYSEIISYMAKTDSTKRPFFRVNDYSGQSEIGMMYVLLKEILQYTLSLRVRTLPYFVISNVSDVGNRPALFLAYTQTPVGINTNRNKFLDTYVSDFYTIIGFSHVITSTECYSEFTLALPGSNESLPQTKKTLVGEHE